MNRASSEPVRRWAFNRRVVDDQTIWVEADTLQEARAKADRDEADHTDDPRRVSRTLRRLPEADEEA